jgi:hypothetical protein
MTIDKAIELMKSGRFFSAEFVKKDGSTRKILARTGVKKYVTGKGMAWSPSERGYVSVYDVQKKEYRLINTKTLTKINNTQL